MDSFAAFSKFRSNCETQRVNNRAQTLVRVNSRACDHTDDHNAVIAPWRQSISISIDQQSCYHVALTWESISHLGCPASLGFHGQRWDKDMRKVLECSQKFSIFIWYKHLQLCQILLPHVPHTWKVWFMGPFCIRRHSLQSRRCQEYCSNSPLKTTWQEVQRLKKTSYHLGNFSQITPN